MILKTALLIAPVFIAFGVVGWLFGWFEGTTKPKNINDAKTMHRYRKMFNI